MIQALEPTQNPGWVLTHEGYNVVTETAVESRFALSNGFLGMRAARSISRGSTWLSWLGYIKWASWPRCYVAGLFDRPNTEPPVPALVPVADGVALIVAAVPAAVGVGVMVAVLVCVEVGLVVCELVGVKVGPPVVTVGLGVTVGAPALTFRACRCPLIPAR